MFGCTYLHYAAHNPDSLKMILKLYPKDHQLDALKQKDTKLQSILHYAAHSSDSLKMILEFLPVHQRLEAVKEKDKEGKTVLDYAAGNSTSLKIIHQCLYKSSMNMLKKIIPSAEEITNVSKFKLVLEEIKQSPQKRCGEEDDSLGLS